MSSTPITQKVYKQLSKKKRPMVKWWQPSVSGMATSTIAGKIPTPILTASGKKLVLPLPIAGEGSGGGKSLLS